MSLQFINVVKNINGGIFSVALMNELFFMKTPKIGVQLVQPQKDGKHAAATAHLDVFEASRLAHNILYVDPSNPDEIASSYKGGPDKNRLGADGQPMIVSRVFRAKRNREKRSVILSVEYLEGERVYATNKFGQKVPGIVKPKRGGQVFMKNSISLTRDEAIYLAKAIERELQAWRTVISADYMRNPQKYRFNGQNASQQGSAPTPAEIDAAFAGPPMEQFPSFDVAQPPMPPQMYQ